MERADNHPGHSRGAPSNPLAVQTGTFVQHGEDWTVGYGAARFPLRNVLGLTYIQRLLQRPGEQFHSLDLLSGTAPSEMLENDPARFARIRDDDNVVVGRPGDVGPILDEQAKRDYRHRISELNEELSELRERGNLNVLGEKDYRRRAQIEAELEALSRQLAEAVGLFGRARRSGSAAERARLSVTRAIRSAIERISERNTALGELLGSCIKTGSFCSYIPNARSPIDWEFTIEGGTPAPIAGTPASASQPSEAQFIQPVRSTTAFVGREKERELLRRCMQEVERGHGGIVVIAGPPGIGKTRIARETGDEARQRGFIALAGNCYDQEDSVPFVPFVELLEVVLARAPGPAAVREILGDQAAELSRLLPQLRRLFPELPAPMEVSAEQSGRMLFNAVVDLVKRQSALNPLLLLLEDLHWADEGTLSLLTQLARSISTMSVMIIATHRNDEIDMKPPLTKALDELIRLDVVEQIRLGGLLQRDVARMVELLSGHQPSPALVDLIYSNTDGNPLFVEELIRDLDETQSNGDFVERLQQGEVALPHSLRVVIGRRLALVSKETRRALGTAAVVGRSFNFTLLEAATHAHPDRLVDSLEEAEKAGLISSRLEYPEARFKFSHELIRRTALDEISIARRQRLHLNIAEAMELLYANSLGEHAEDLAHHFWSAGAPADSAKAVKYLALAGNRALIQGGYDAALRNVRRALDLLEKTPHSEERLKIELELQVAYGTALRAIKGWYVPEFGSAYRRAHLICEKLGSDTNLFDVLSGLWSFHLVRGEHDKARIYAEDMVRRAPLTADRGTLVQAFWASGCSQFFMGDFCGAHASFRQAVDHYDQDRDRSLGMRFGQDPCMSSLCFDAMTLWLSGDGEQAAKSEQESLKLARDLGRPFSLVWCLSNLGKYHTMRRDYAAAEKIIDEALTLCSEHHFRFYEGMNLTYWGIGMALQGRSDELKSRSRRPPKVVESDAAISQTYVYSALAESFGKTGKIARALSLLDKASELASRNQERYVEAEIHRVRGETILNRIEFEHLSHPAAEQARAEARNSFQTALKVADGAGAKILQLRAAVSLGGLLARTGRSEEARQLLVPIFKGVSASSDVPDVREALALMERLESAAG